MRKNIENITETEELTTEHLAMEMLHDEQEKSKAKNIGIIVLGMVTATSIVAMVVTTIYLSEMNYKNDQKWRDLFNSYNYISQDNLDNSLDAE